MPAQPPRTDTVSDTSSVWQGSGIAGEPSISMSTTNRSAHSLYKLKLSYRPEYKKAHWWVRYDEPPGADGNICSILRNGLKYQREIIFSLLNFCEYSVFIVNIIVVN